MLYQMSETIGSSFRVYRDWALGAESNPATWADRDDVPRGIASKPLARDERIEVPAALALMLFGALLSHRIQTERSTALGAITLVGSAAAGTFLLLDAPLFWVLALPDISGDPAVLRALHGLSYLCGGVALALPLAALIGAVSLDALHFRTLPGWLA